MAILELKLEKGYGVSMSSDSSELIDIIKGMATCHYSDKVFDYRSKTFIFTSMSQFFGKKKGNKILFKRGMAEIIFYELQKEYDNLSVEISELKVDPKLAWLWRLGESSPETFIRISDKWLNIFKGHPKGPERAEMQRIDALKIASESSGLVDLFTGAGKTEILLSQIESFLGMPEYDDSNALIFVYGNKVRDEIFLRAKQYGVNLTKDFDINSRLNIINVSAFARTNRFKEAAVKEWLQKVDLIAADEGHHMSADTWHSMVIYCDPLFVYAFTGSADVNAGSSTNRGEVKVNKGDPRLLKVVEVTGFSLVSRSLPTPINVFRVQTDIGNQTILKGLADSKYMQDVVDYWITDPTSAKLIASLYRRVLNPKKICFITIRTVEPGAELVRNLNKEGIKAVLWTGQKSLLPFGQGLTTEYDLGLQELKSLAEEKSFDILVASSIAVEGIDLRNLGSVIPLVDRSFKMLAQPTGRAAREDELDLVFIFDKQNGMLTSQMKSKYKMAKSKFNIVSNKAIEQKYLIG